MNFSKNLCYTHKNDYMFYSTSVEGQSVKVFVTKSYKLVKINFNNEYIFDVEDFITLLASSICKKNICKKLGLKRNFNFTFKRTNFKISYKNNSIINCSYTKAVQMLKALNSLFFSFILSRKHIKHIDDKKTFISNMYSYVLNNFKMNINFDKFLMSVESNISDLFVHEVNNKPFLLNIVTYAFIKNM
jgi:hypothetical protein